MLTHRQCGACAALVDIEGCKHWKPGRGVQTSDGSAHMMRSWWHKINPFKINDVQATRREFEAIIVANYDKNIGARPNGELPVIAPRWHDLIGDGHES